MSSVIFSIKRLLLLVLHLKFIINFSSLFCYCELWVPFFFVVCAPCVLCAQHRTVISILNRRKCYTNKTDSQFSDKNSIEAEPSEEIIDALFFVFVVVVSLSFIRISSGFVQFCPINCWAFHIYKRISHRQALVSVLESIVTVDNEQSNRVWFNKIILSSDIVKWIIEILIHATKANEFHKLQRDFWSENLEFKETFIGTFFATNFHILRFKHFKFDFQHEFNRYIQRNDDTAQE